MNQESDPFLAKLRQKLAQRAALPRPEWEARPAAVLLPLYQQAGEWHLLFTRRTDTVENHQGQVSFPGGVMEAGEGPEEAALRETYEEIGVPPQAIQVLGRLDPLLTVTQFLVTPVVGRIPWPVELHLNRREVARVFGVPVRWLAQPANLQMHLHQAFAPGPPIPVYSFRPYEGEVIWGATARITLNFLAIAGLRRAP